MRVLISRIGNAKLDPGQQRNNGLQRKELATGLERKLKEFARNVMLTHITEHEARAHVRVLRSEFDEALRETRDQSRVVEETSSTVLENTSFRG